MPPVDIRTIITEFANHPLTSFSKFAPLVADNFWENKWRILVILLLWFAIRAAVLYFLDELVPDPKSPRRGQLLRRVLLRKFTDENGRLLRLGKNKPNKNYYERRSERAAAIVSIIKSATNVIFGLTLTITLLAQLGIETNGNTIGWVFGFIGVALTLGSQQVVRDVINGLQVIGEDQYGLGDYIEVSETIMGEVVFIGLRTTRLRGEDGTIYHVRHSNVMGIANRTQAAGSVVMDMKFVWGDMQNTVVGSKELEFAESLIRETLVSLRKMLHLVKGHISNEPAPHTDSIQLSDVAAVIPSIAPGLDQTMINKLADISATTAPITGDLAVAQQADIELAAQAIENSDPVFKEFSILGLIGSEENSLTIRIHINFDSPKHQHVETLAAIRKRLFSVFAQHGISVTFAEAPRNSVL